MKNNERQRAAHRRAALGALLLSSTGVLADTPVEVEPVVVSATRSGDQWAQAALAASVVDAGDSRGEQALTLGNLLSAVPGVVVQSRYNAAQGLRPAIRGFGSRSSFGVRGIRVLVDGVPLTMPDGQTELDGFDLGLVERMEVLRGPAAVLYGNGAGGVLAINTREPGEQPSVAGDVSFGSYGFRRQSVEASGSEGNVGALVALSSTQSEGYREHATSEANNLTGKLRWWGDTGRLALTLHALDNRSEDPGGLTLGQVRADRNQARPQSLSFDSDERVTQQRLSLVWDGQPVGEDTYQIRSYVGQRDFENRLPLAANGQTSYERLFGGIGANYTHVADWFGLGHKLTFGADLESLRDDRDRNNNIVGGEKGALTSRQREEARSLGLFIENQTELTENWLLSLGLRHDTVRLNVDDHFLRDGDDSGKRNLRDLNYSAGLSYRLDPHHTLYARVATSFETPTVSELANPNGGGFNSSLEPAEALNQEIGFKGETTHWRYEAVVYRIDTRDELVPYVNGRTFYRNAGSTRRDGLELSARWQPDEHWQLTTAYSLNDYTYRSFENADGNRLPGIPVQSLFGELSYSRDNWYVRVNTSVFDRQYADSGNTARVGGYALVNLRMGMQLKGWAENVEPYVGLDNLTDRRYYDNLRINDSGVRYYEPAPGRTGYVGVKVRF
ncbi:TonB-dependent receptor family protein [Pseudomonas japonica]|uniref:Iron complex outermembrane recepter protein n=1 Tax=Pseudomonas japonica TaxID=256466 RepID=A0A239GI68_9PSED|nr:TonB-dependent receptor [Pseudomonas japonica]SNS68839.1 iron complex outermembrane recepter protein [Pseudomonas japonica]